uniref:Longitudinals lacking protein, isoforms A/B/D/L n=1 Tax=Cacopsylla melanoneura TaxID=428564 RepID=A0A8D8WTI4_9HEMI
MALGRRQNSQDVNNISALYLKYIQDLNQAATLMRLSSLQPQTTTDAPMSDLFNLIQNKRRAAKQIVAPAPPTDSDIFSCPKCAKTYLRQYTLNAHLRYECGKRPKFKCPFCNKKCHQKCNLKSHIALKHDQVTTQN